MLERRCTWGTSEANTRVFSELKLTSHTKFAAFVGVVELPDPSIVASMPIICPSECGGSAVADARRQQSPTSPREVICH